MAFQGLILINLSIDSPTSLDTECQTLDLWPDITSCLANYFAVFRLGFQPLNNSLSSFFSWQWLKLESIKSRGTWTQTRKPQKQKPANVHGINKEGKTTKAKSERKWISRHWPKRFSGRKASIRSENTSFCLVIYASLAYA